ncbi:hypothetical protein [Lentimicrobium sp. S6]|uniref:hypothetical protein n=1 Tax=Lentimicrobium sp. S6 TaxID=2735872 RepID=UPI001554A655|nr:hypothetical protein [Lentimicrobium sp. S6]NPD47272.1 hypothetical protein [Lentimicrobium sp. S6]
MKKVNNYLGVLGGLLMLIGVLFNSLHYPGADILILVSGVLGILYFILSVFSVDSTTSTPCAKIAEYFIPITMIVFLTSFVFKVLHWPGGSVLVSISTWMFILSSLLLLLSILMNKDKQFISLNKVVFAIIYLIPVLVFISKPF